MALLFYTLLTLTALRDIHYSKIDNEITGFGLFAIMVLRYCYFGGEDLLYHMEIMLATCLILLPFQKMRCLGGGDVKLLSICGMFLESGVYMIFLTRAVILSALCSLFVMIIHRSRKVRMGLPVLMAAITMWEEIIIMGGMK